MPEPTPLTAALAEFIERHGADTRLGAVGVSMLRAHGHNQDRRAAVLRHPDLAARLTQEPFSYRNPAQWNGYIPPAVAIDDDGGLLRRIEQNGRAVFNQLGKRSCGTMYNNSPHRMILLEISTEAWNREHNPAITSDN